MDVERRRASRRRERGAYQRDSFIQKEARPLFDVNTLQHLPDGFAVMTGLGVAGWRSAAAAVERRKSRCSASRCWRKRTAGGVPAGGRAAAAG